MRVFKFEYYRRFFFTAFFVLLTVSFVGPVLADESNRDEGAVQILPTAENDPSAVIKEGFISKVEKGRVYLQDMNTYRVRQYRLEEDYRIFYNNEVKELYDVPPHSIVKLIMIEGQVKEIIVLQRSS